MTGQAKPITHDLLLARLRASLTKAIPDATLADSRELERTTKAQRMLDASHEGTS